MSPQNRINKVEAAKILEISPRTLEGWIQRGKAPRYFKYFKRTFFDRRDVEQFKKAHTVEFKAG